MLRSDSIAKLAAAKAQAQALFRPIGKDKSATVTMRSGGKYSYSYADLASCLEAVMEPLAKSGLALFQPVEVKPDPEGHGKVIATTLLVHGESGEWISSDYEAPITDSNDARSVGSAATYARRYGLISLLGIAPSEEDDDGEQARGGGYEMQPRAAPRQQPPPAKPPPQQPDQPEMTAADKAKAFATAARDKQIFDDAIGSGIKREEFHAWAEMALGHPYAKNTDWNEDDRRKLEGEIGLRKAEGGARA